MRLACQDHGSQYLAAVCFNVTAQIGQCSAHSDEIIHHDVIRAHLNSAIKFRLARKARKTICPGVGNDIHLYHAAIHLPSKPLRQFVGKYFRYGIHPVLLISVSANQDGSVFFQ